MGEEIILPFWMKAMFGPGILFFIIMPFLGALVAWKLIFDSYGDDVEKKDRRISVFKTWLTAFLCNLLSCVLLFIVEMIMRQGDGVHLSSLEIWNDFLTIIVYLVPVIISFFIIKTQVKRRARYMVSDKTPARVASWIYAILFSPWFILIPSSAIWNLTDLIG